jgi:hypothetical protein
MLTLTKKVQTKNLKAGGCTKSSVLLGKQSKIGSYGLEYHFVGGGGVHTPGWQNASRKNTKQKGAYEVRNDGGGRG